MVNDIIWLNGVTQNKVFVIIAYGFHYLYIGYRLKNEEELFNLHHASAQNIIEHIFGVVKQCFRILLVAPEYSLDIQAQIPAALCHSQCHLYAQC